MQTLWIGHEQIIANKLCFLAQSIGQEFPAVPVVFGATVFNGYNRVIGCPIRPECHHLFTREGFVFTLEMVFAVFIQFGYGWVERDEHLLACGITRLFDGEQKQIKRLTVGFEVRGKAAFVANVGVVAFAREHFFQRVKGFNTSA